MDEILSPISLRASGVFARPLETQSKMREEDKTIAPAPLEELLAGALPEQVQTTHHALRLFASMEEMLSAMWQGMTQAKEHVLLETYIFRDDRLGRGLADVLAAAVQRGLDVRVIYDPLGSQETDPAFFDEMRERGIDVRAYRPANIAFDRGSVFPRDHSRVIVIDNHSYTGGAAWGDEWLPRRFGGHGWHDVCMQIEGPCVEDFRHLFEMRWREANGEDDSPEDFAVVGKYSDLQLLADAPSHVDLVYERYLKEIRAAKKRIWICNAYFYPPAELRDALFEAAARGVDVQVISTGSTDLPIIHRAARADYAYWINNGLHIFEYRRGVLHAKYALFDDTCTIGTMNINPTSMRLSNEVNVFVEHPAFVKRVKGLFERDRKQSEEISLEEALDRPLLQQLADHIACDGLRLIDVFLGPPAHASDEQEP